MAKAKGCRAAFVGFRAYCVVAGMSFGVYRIKQWPILGTLPGQIIVTSKTSVLANAVGCYVSKAVCMSTKCSALMYTRHFGVLSGDFLNTNEIYEDILDFSSLKQYMETQMREYNATPGVVPMNLVLFRDAISHVCRTVRVLKLPRGNMLLVGIGKFIAGIFIIAVILSVVRL